MERFSHIYFCFPHSSALSFPSPPPPSFVSFSIFLIFLQLPSPPPAPTFTSPFSFFLFSLPFHSFLFSLPCLSFSLSPRHVLVPFLHHYCLYLSSPSQFPLALTSSLHLFHLSYPFQKPHSFLSSPLICSPSLKKGPPLHSLSSSSPLSVLPGQSPFDFPRRLIHRALWVINGRKMAVATA